MKSFTVIVLLAVLSSCLAAEKKNFTCFQCAGDKTPLKGLWLRCAEWRSHLRFFDGKLNNFKKSGGNNYTKFIVNCDHISNRTRECYNIRAVDTKILGFEHRGCGSGSKDLPAEPYEGCEKAVLNMQGEAIEMQNCLCDKDNCNLASSLTGIVLLPFASALIPLIWSKIQFF